jgi:LysM repeat protein
MKRAGLLLLLAAAALSGACARRGHLILRKAKAREALALTVPEPLTPTVQAAPQALTVAKGDSLWRLSRKNLGAGIRYSELAAANSIREPWIIQPGQVLSLPSGTPTPASPTAAAAVAPSPKAVATATAKAGREAAKYGWQKKENHAYTVGEKLTFAVQYGSITAGYATLSITEQPEIGGRPTLHVVAEAKTHPFFETFFKVRDRIESFIDLDYGFPWRYEKHLREGGYSADAFYLFDQRAGKIVEPDKGKEAPMPIGSQDVMSCFYWFRTLPLNVGDEATIPVTADDMKSYQLKVNVLRKEKAETLAGDFDCIVVEPHLTFQGVFQQKGQVLLWITDDARRIPVKIRSKIAIGSININLQDAEWVEPAGN